MTKMFVSEIQDRSQVDSVFLVKEKISALARNGKPYLTLHLMDKSGEIEGRVWENVESIGQLFEKDNFVRLKAKATVYLGKMQLIISDLACVADSKVALEDFLPEGDRDAAEMLVELSALVESCSDCHLRRLLLSFVEDPAFLELYRTAPAAKGMHHVYLGGLLEHSLSVARLVDQIMPLYPQLQRDLLIAGALLHDVGKVREMTYLRSFDYTDEGKLLGHISIGVEMIHEKIVQLDGFPAELAMLLKHMILSHHGQYEFGSPKRPKTIEATVLNYLDDLDSKINGIRTHMRKELANHSRWTGYHRLYDRYFYKNAGCDRVINHPPEETPAQEPVPEIMNPGNNDMKKSGFRNSPFEGLREKSSE
ncbi:MAG: HD domain-containing protein [Deltaproteobacteria bacterium]|nr:HD domain-containing protein [Deltaproteobacteria bacterium]TLN04567.1 MAG: HD domain-containing protein [bacterium]